MMLFEIALLVDLREPGLYKLQPDIELILNPQALLQTALRSNKNLLC